MLYEELLNNFHRKLNDIQEKCSNQLEEANQAITLCTETLNKLKKLVSSDGLENRHLEILFFKEIKVIPMQYLIYYIEVRSCEVRMPKIGKKHQLKFLEKQVDKVNRIFGIHTEFLIYLDQGHTHFDKLYFTRKNLNYAPVIESYPYYKDPVFNTSHDGILARLQGLGLFTNYLMEKRKDYEKTNMATISDKINSKINWTGSYAAFIEMLYGCDAMGYFNDGNMNIGKLIEELGHFLNVEKGNYSRTYNELKNRKHSRVKFFEETGQKLLDRMDKEDGQHSNS